MRDLGATLLQLRKHAGLSGTRAAQLAGLSQSRISRAETGKFTPGPDQVSVLCRIYGASVEVRAELVALAREVAEKKPPTRVVVQRSRVRIQQRISRMEKESSIIRDFHPSVIIGLLQTRDYIAEVFRPISPSPDATKAIQERINRQKVLKSDREFVLVMAEGALRWQLGSPSVMIAQLEHLIKVAKFPNVRLGIISWTTPAHTVPIHGFHIYDSTTVTIGTTTGQAIITDENEITKHEKLFAQFVELAAFDKDATAVIKRVTDDYRTLL